MTVHERGFRGTRALALPVFCFFALVSCARALPVEFAVRGSGAALFAGDSLSAAGVLDFSKPAKLKFHFQEMPALLPPVSLEIEYSFSAPLTEEIKKNYQLVFEAGDGQWLLPFDLSFLEPLSAGAADGAFFHYAVPVEDPFPLEFCVSLVPTESGAARNRRGREELPLFTIHSLAISGRWYGFHAEEHDDGRHFFVSPFVFARNGGAAVEYLIDPPGEGREAFDFSLSLLPGGDSGAVVSAENFEFELTRAADGLYLPPGIIALDAGPVRISGERAGAFSLCPAAVPVFPAPLTADPGVALDWPREHWRDSRFEIFRWDAFPSLLIFDTADYAVQDRLFKRLAFFVEKAGFRGRLAADIEIDGLHGWNAHDYRAVDLARFFESARVENFPLLNEERELERILLEQGIIRRARDGTIESGAGGIISVSRESADYLRSLFMAHEGFHGLFFIDEDFRDFSRERWQALSRQDKDFILSFFDYQRYDTGDEYLTINEFMAHILQQPVSRAGVYFGETLPRRLQTSPRRAAVLDGKDEQSNSWPRFAAAFTQEARAFSEYVNNRWGLSAGRVWKVF